MSNLPSRKKYHILPAIVSFFLPGVGQVIKGHFKKGIALLVGFAIAWLANWLFGWIPLVGGLFWVLYAITIAIGVVDALISKKDIRNLPGSNRY